MTKYQIVLFIILLNAVMPVSQALDILVVGLFSGKAVLQIEGQQHLLTVDQTSPEGVKLLSASSQRAVIEFDGQQQTLVLGEHRSSHFKAPAALATVSLWPTQGMYITTGSINGYTVDFLVDTGASAVALNSELATRLGIDFYQGQRIRVQTASGVDWGYQLSLDKVQVGNIVQHQVTAIVLEGSEPNRVLLGMSFLGQLDIQRQGERLDLLKRF